MKNYIKNSEYVIDSYKNIWVRPGYEGISYNDGEEIELRIASIIDRVSDKTVLSTELRQHCTDWPSLYHLSGTRANILRPFAGLLTGDILEIGAGCGAITRYLGECGGKVLALEGSPRRAGIARSRTSDLENVTVLAEKFASFQCDHKFDVITLIGVLEYANMFTPSESPALTMLQQVRSLLKPDGKLIIAIENQLGLKYFAGAPEDHLGQPMYGIEGRYQKDQPQTFGRQELSDLLVSAGFFKSSFLAAFPDYKLPTSILTEAGCSNKSFDAATFAWQSVRRDYQLPVNTTFSLELAWGEIFKNGLALDLANSFLVLANCAVEVKEPNEISLAFHYSTERQPFLCKETHFFTVDGNNINVQPRALVEVEKLQFNHANSGLSWIPPCNNNNNYIRGRVLAEDFIKIVTAHNWYLQDVTQFIRQYFAILAILIQDSNVSFENIESILPNQYLDALPSNLILIQTNQAVFVDNEWCARNGVEVGYLLFRALTSLINMVSRFGIPKDDDVCTKRSFIEKVFSELGFPISDSDLQKYLSLEEQLYAFSSGLENTRFNISLLDQKLPGLETDDSRIFERLALIEAAKDYAERLALEREAELMAIKTSKAWRIMNKIRLNR